MNKEILEEEDSQKVLPKESFFKKGFGLNLMTFLLCSLILIVLIVGGSLIAKGPKGHLDVPSSLTLKVGETMEVTPILSEKLSISKISISIDEEDEENIKAQLDCISVVKTKNSFLITALKPVQTTLIFLFNEDSEQVNHNKVLSLTILE